LQNFAFPDLETIPCYERPPGRQYSPGCHGAPEGPVALAGQDVTNRGELVPMAEAATPLLPALVTALGVPAQAASEAIAAPSTEYRIILFIALCPCLGFATPTSPVGRID
jgi:hypothetical protein